MRFDLEVIPHWIKPGSRVLDLGCGDGELLKKLQTDKQVDGLGIEIDDDLITTCIGKGLNIVEQDLNKGLANFQDDSFDIVVMAHALQTLHDPHVVIDEMLRVGKECIVTFPNFAHWSCRLHLSRKGRMPVSKFMPYNWYDTPNIHFCTVKDFEALCAENNIKVLATTAVSHDSSESFLGHPITQSFWCDSGLPYQSKVGT